MRVVITGVTGLLGRYLLETASAETEVHGLARGNWPAEMRGGCTMHVIDLADIPQTTRLIRKINPDAIVHAAAEGRVDTVEGNLSKFRPLNVDLARSLATLSSETGAKMVHVSSNAVFSGSGPPYSDAASTDPINDYGRLKAEAEIAVQEILPSALILRPILMYGWPNPGRRPNPVSDWIVRMRAGHKVNVVDDVWTEPLAAWDCARAIWNGVSDGVAGTVNVSGGVKMSLFTFAVLTAAVFNLDTRLIEPVPSSRINLSAPRPRDTAFTLTRLREELHVEPVTPAIGLQILRDTEARR